MGGNQVRRHLLWWATLTLAGLLAVVRLSTLQGLLLDDLEVYRLGGLAVLDHQHVYDAASGRLHFTYPPFAALVFVPLALLPSQVSGWLVTACSVAAFAIVGSKVAGFLGLSARGSLPLVLVMASSEPVARTIVLGQINLVLMALIVLDALVVRAQARGLLSGLAASIKLTPGVFLLYYLLRRDWGTVGRMVSISAVFTGLAWVVLPGDSTRYWSGTVGELGRFGRDDVVGSHNQSLYALGLRTLGVAESDFRWVIVAALAGLALGTVAAARCLRAGDLLAALVAVALGALLASPVSWTHHWVWLLVVALWLWGSGRRGIAWVVAGCAWLAPMWGVTVTAATVASLGPEEIIVASTYTVVALGLLVVMIARPARRIEGT